MASLSCILSAAREIHQIKNMPEYMQKKKLERPKKSVKMQQDDPFLECPYNKAHQVLKSRMQYHLVKCRKQNNNEEKVVCPFDATHHINKTEFNIHLEICSNRKVIESHVYQVGEESLDSAKVDKSVYQNITIPEGEENWDEDESETYDPLKKTEDLPVFRSLEGGTRAERKAFRLGERQRIQELKEKEKKKLKEMKNQKVYNINLTVEEPVPFPHGGHRLRTPLPNSFNQALERSQEIALSHHNQIDQAKKNVSSQLENSFASLKFKE